MAHQWLTHSDSVLAGRKCQDIRCGGQAYKRTTPSLKGLGAEREKKYCEIQVEKILFVLSI